MDLDTILQKHQIQPGTTKIIDIGCVQLTATRTKEGWHLETKDNCPDDDIALDDASTISDYFQTGKSNSLIIAPALPVKPMVFKGSGLNVLPGQKLTIFVKIPLTFQLYFSKVQPENLLREITYKRMSNTWFGEADSGEPAYTLGSEYFLDFNDIQIIDFEAICPVSLINSATDNLLVQRVIIRDEFLSLYKNGNQMVTSHVQIDYKGKDSISAVDYQYSKQFCGDKQEVLAKPRNSSGKNLLKINFHFIKNIYRTD